MIMSAVTLISVFLKSEEQLKQSLQAVKCYFLENKVMSKYADKKVFHKRNTYNKE